MSKESLETKSLERDPFEKLRDEVLELIDGHLARDMARERSK